MILAGHLRVIYLIYFTCTENKRNLRLYLLVTQVQRHLMWTSYSCCNCLTLFTVLISCPTRGHLVFWRYYWCHSTTTGAGISLIFVWQVALPSVRHFTLTFIRAPSLLLWCGAAGRTMKRKQTAYSLLPLLFPLPFFLHLSCCVAFIPFLFLWTTCCFEFVVNGCFRCAFSLNPFSFHFPREGQGKVTSVVFYHTSVNFIFSL